MTAPDDNSENPLALAADVVAAFVSCNALPRADLPGLIQSVYAALAQLPGATAETSMPAVKMKEPAVPIRKSLTDDYLICLEDGKKFKSLRRHLTGLGITPEEYRLKWNLPADYPMVAPNYAARRSELAKRIGLGQMRGNGGARKRGGPAKVAPVT